MNIKEFRDQFPCFRPHAPCQHKDGRRLEVISWPYSEDLVDSEHSDPIFINARMPNDPTTLERYRISGDDPDLFALQGFCERHDKHFVPIIVGSDITGVSAGLTGCPLCGPGIHPYTLQRVKLTPTNNESNQQTT